jgi:nucleotide-binding universal stress UspA family protein
MSDYPYLSLNQITIDPELARTLPRRLAFYYLALPLARDDEQLTLVMAHPENQLAVNMLESALGARVVPVQGSGAEIRAALDLVWTGETGPRTTRILCWGSTPEQAALAASVADVVARALLVQTVSMDASQCNLDTILSLAREEHYSLTVIDEPPDDTVSHVLRHSSTPVLLVRGASLALRHILLVLRGHSPDEHVLDWIIPLALAAQARVSLLTLSPAVAQAGQRRHPRTPSRLASLLSTDSEAGQHIRSCAHRLTGAGIKGQLRLRQGLPEQSIASEVSQGDYDLITLAAEAHGDFVQRVLSRIKALPANNQQPVLVIKPMAG